MQAPAFCKRQVLTKVLPASISVLSGMVTSLMKRTRSQGKGVLVGGGRVAVGLGGSGVKVGIAVGKSVGMDNVAWRDGERVTGATYAEAVCAAAVCKLLLPASGVTVPRGILQALKPPTIQADNHSLNQKNSFFVLMARK